MGKKKVYLMLASIILFFLVCAIVENLMKELPFPIRARNVPGLMTDAFVGSYSCDDTPRCYLEVLPTHGNVFYYLDYTGNVYISGTFTEESNNTYKLTGDKIDTQTITCSDLKVTITINNEEKKFTKTDEVPAIPTNLDELLDNGDEGNLESSNP